MAGDPAASAGSSGAGTPGTGPATTGPAAATPPRLSRTPSRDRRGSPRPRRSALLTALWTPALRRTLTVTRMSGEVVTVPLAPRTARTIDLAIGERAEGPLFMARDGRRLDRAGSDAPAAPEHG